MLRNESKYTYSKHGGNYAIFEKFVEGHRSVFEKKPDELTTIGAISRDDNAYFVRTEDSVKHAQAFLSGFFSSESHRQAIIDMQNNKGSEDAFPSCISFVDVDVEGKKYCLVSLSGAYEDKQDIINLLQDYIEKLGNNRNPEYILLDGKTEDISKLLANLQDPVTEDTFKTCAEKHSISALIKIFLKYGDKAIVTGSINCGFFPYLEGASYGRRNGSMNEMVVYPFHERISLDLDDRIFVTILPCCSACKANKKSAQVAMKCGQYYGNNELKFTTSPLINSCKTRNSLTGSSGEMGTSLTRHLADPDLPALSEIDSEEDYSSEEETLLDNHDRSSKTSGKINRNNNNSNINANRYDPDYEGDSTTRAVSNDNQSPRLFSNAPNKLHKRRMPQVPISPATNSKRKGKESVDNSDKPLEKFDYDLVSSIVKLWFQKFNLRNHILERKQKMEIPKDKNLLKNIREFVEDFWDDHVEPLHKRQDKDKILEGLIKAAYRLREETTGWLCFKRTIYIAEFDRKAALHYLVKKLGNTGSYLEFLTEDEIASRLQRFTKKTD